MTYEAINEFVYTADGQHFAVNSVAASETHFHCGKSRLYATSEDKPNFTGYALTTNEYVAIGEGCTLKKHD